MQLNWMIKWYHDRLNGMPVLEFINFGPVLSTQLNPSPFKLNSLTTSKAYVLRREFSKEA